MADESVGSLVVKILFESNAGEVLGQISASSVKSAADLDKMLGSVSGINLQLNQSNQVIEKTVEQFSKAQTVSQPFTVTINRLNQEFEQSTGPIVSQTETIEKNIEMKRQMEAAAQNEAIAEQQMGNEATTAAEKFTAAGQQELGIIEKMKIDVADLKLALEAATNPADVERLTVELRNAESALASAEGKSMGFAIRGMRQARIETFAATQGLLALSFILSSFDTTHASDEMKSFHQSIQVGAQTAFGLSSALIFMGGTAASTAVPIGLAAGALVALYSGFTRTDEAAKKAAEEGLKIFSDKLQFITTAGQGGIAENLKSQLDAIDKLLDAQVNKAGELQTKAFSAAQALGAGAIPSQTVGVTKEQIDNALKEVQLTEKQRDILTQMKDEVQKRLDTEQVLELIQSKTVQITDGQLNRVGEIKAQLELLNKELETGVGENVKQYGLEEGIRVSKEAKVELERQLKELQLTSTEQIREQIKLEETRHADAVARGVGEKESEETLRHVLESSLKLTDDESLRLEIHQKLVSLQGEDLTNLKEQHDAGKLNSDEYISQLKSLLAITENGKLRQQIEAAIEEEVSAQSKAMLEQEKSAEKLRDITEKAIAASTQGEFARKLAEEAERHKKTIEEISKQTGATQEGEAGPETQAAIEARRAEDVLHAENVSRIEIEKEIKLFDLQKQGHEKSIQDIQDREKLEEALINKTEKDKDIAAARIAAAQRTSAEEIQQIQDKQYAEALDSIQKIGDALHRAFSKTGDEFLQKILTALQFAVQIARALESAGRNGGSGGGLFGFLGQLLGIGAGLGLGVATGGIGDGAVVTDLPVLVQNGGFTGRGQADEPAGIVHRGEIVFEKPLVDRHFNELMTLRAQLQKGYQSGGYVVSPSGEIVNRIATETLMKQTSINMMDLEPLVAELRQQREMNRVLSERIEAIGNPTVDLSGHRLDVHVDNQTGTFRKLQDEYRIHNDQKTL